MLIRGIAFGAVALVTLAAAHAGGRPVRVVAPDGALDATASVACLTPPSDPVPVDADGTAMVRSDCTRVRCASEFWLPGEGVVEHGGFRGCALAPAVRPAIELPREAHGGFELRVQPSGNKGAPVEATVTLGVAASREPVVLPPMRPGHYELSVRRVDGTWTCRSSPLWKAPGRLRVLVPWRDPVTVRGRVGGIDGAPVAGMPIATSGAVSGKDPSGIWRCGTGESRPILSAIDGSFDLQIDPKVETLVVAGTWGDARGIDFVSRTGATATPLRLAPRPPHRVVARVLDTDDHAVTCATRLEVDDPDETWAARVVPGSARSTKCATDGKIQLGPFRSSSFTLDVRPEDALPARRRGTGVIDGETKDLGIIRIERGATLGVEVFGENQEPVGGALVTAANDDAFIVQRKARSGPDGKAVLAGLPREVPVYVVVEAKGYARFQASGVNVGAVPFRVTLHGGTELRGRVRDPEGQPVRAKVRVTRPDQEPLATVETDGDGRFVASGASSGVALVSASAPGYRPSAPARVEMNAVRADDEIVLEVRETGTLQGVVLDPDRRPLAGTSVLVVPGDVLGDPPEESASAVTVSALDGTFAIALDVSRGEDLYAVAPGFAPAKVNARELAQADRIELVLRPSARLLARLPPSLSPAATLLIDSASGVARAIATRSKEEVLVDDLAPGFGRVSLDRSGSKNVNLVAGETALVDFTSHSRVRGRVTRAGRGLARAVVAIAEVSPGSIQGGDGVLTDDDGAFVIEAVPPGTYTLFAQAAGVRAERSVIVPSSGELVVDLEVADSQLRVAVTDAASGSAIAGARVIASPIGVTCRSHIESSSVQDGFGWKVSISDAGCVEARSGFDGSASLAMPSVGPHRVDVIADGYEPWSAAFELVDGAIDAHAALRKGGPPTVRVVFETETPGLVGSLYCVQGGLSSSHGGVVGEAVCEGLVPGPAEVVVRVAGFGLGRASITVPEHGEVTVAVAVPHGGVIVIPLGDSAAHRIRITDGAGTVWNQPYGLGWPPCLPEARDDRGPSYVCRDVPPGLYTIEIDGARRGSATVRPGETVFVE